jgi:hypothetical protein
VSRSIDLRWKKPLYSPRRWTSRCCLFRPESPGSRDRSLRGKSPRTGVSSRRRAPTKDSGQSLRPHIWGERHPTKKSPGDLGRSLRSLTQSLRCVNTGVSGQETRSLRRRKAKMLRYLSIDNKHPKIDFARKCSFNLPLFGV